MTISHLCQQKAFSQFSYQMKPRLKVDREMIQFWHILCEEAEAESCRKGRGYDWWPKMKLTTRNQLVQSHILISSNGGIHCSDKILTRGLLTGLSEGRGLLGDESGV